MDTLKNFIDTNREDFDSDLLPEGHLERFEKKLERTKRLRQFRFIAVAVAAIAGLLLFLKIQSDISEDSRPQPLIFTCESGKEIKQLYLHYNRQMDEVEAQIKNLYAQGETSGSLELMEEAEQVIQSTYDFEADILPTLPCSDAGVFVINQHYHNSLESLNFMLKQMKKIINTTHNH
ncbi:MAG: hypothetical protein LBP25_05595 [Tannerellaceae bacterium]|jgi:hypothetical protein|nr:hypothetical protein [Tannerellaceae bacterium]